MADNYGDDRLNELQQKYIRKNANRSWEHLEKKSIPETKKTSKKKEISPVRQSFMNAADHISGISKFVATMAVIGFCYLSANEVQENTPNTNPPLADDSVTVETAPKSSLRPVARQP
jgi:hypothetical protein